MAWKVLWFKLFVHAWDGTTGYDWRGQKRGLRPSMLKNIKTITSILRSWHFWAWQVVQVLTTQQFDRPNTHLDANCGTSTPCVRQGTRGLWQVLKAIQTDGDDARRIEIQEDHFKWLHSASSRYSIAERERNICSCNLKMNKRPSILNSIGTPELLSFSFICKDTSYFPVFEFLSLHKPVCAVRNYCFVLSLRWLKGNFWWICNIQMNGRLSKKLNEDFNWKENLCVP